MLTQQLDALPETALQNGVGNREVAPASPGMGKDKVRGMSVPEVPPRRKNLLRKRLEVL